MASKKLYTETYIQDIADAIREKAGTSDTMTIAEMAQAIMDIPAGGGGDIDALLDGSITDLTTSAPSIFQYACYRREMLTSVIADNALTIGQSAFEYCLRLASVIAPALTQINADAFNSCKNLTNFTAPALERIGSDVFYGCSALATADFPALTSMGSSAFDGCSALATADFPALTSMDLYAIRNCTHLTEIILGPVAKIEILCMTYDSALKTLVLRRSDAITALGNVNAFQGTPFASKGSGGTLYVPQDLISTYQAATNWSVILGYTNNRILPIEGSEYDTNN